MMLPIFFFSFLVCMAAVTKLDTAATARIVRVSRNSSFTFVHFVYSKNSNTCITDSRDCDDEIIRVDCTATECTLLTIDISAVSITNLLSLYSICWLGINNLLLLIIIISVFFFSILIAWSLIIHAYTDRHFFVLEKLKHN